MKGVTLRWARQSGKRPTERATNFRNGGCAKVRIDTRVPPACSGPLIPRLISWPNDCPEWRMTRNGSTNDFSPGSHGPPWEPVFPRSAGVGQPAGIDVSRIRDHPSSLFSQRRGASKYGVPTEDRGNQGDEDRMAGCRPWHPIPIVNFLPPPASVRESGRLEVGNRPDRKAATLLVCIRMIAGDCHPVAVEG